MTDRGRRPDWKEFLVEPARATMLRAAKHMREHGGYDEWAAELEQAATEPFDVMTEVLCSYTSYDRKNSFGGANVILERKGQQWPTEQELETRKTRKTT